jgi:hypothetical protein
MSTWAISCYVYAVLAVVVNIIFTIAFTIGGFVDLIEMLKELKTAEIDDTDDGRVAHS